jgi:hypothetical protein
VGDETLLALCGLAAAGAVLAVMSTPAAKTATAAAFDASAAKLRAHAIPFVTTKCVRVRDAAEEAVELVLHRYNRIRIHPADCPKHRWEIAGRAKVAPTKVEGEPVPEFTKGRVASPPRRDPARQPSGRARIGNGIGTGPGTVYSATEC